MKLSLVVLSVGKNSGQAISITQPQFLIGRDPDCQIRPASPMISKKHCALIQQGGKVYVKDFGSTNGTFVNDVKVEGHKELQNEDVLKVGPLQFKVALEVSVPVDKPTPLPATSKKAPGLQPRPATPPPPTKTPEPAKTGPTAEAPAPKPKAPPKREPESNLGDTELGSATSGGEDDIAALLLSLDESEGGSGDEIPGGTTLMEIPAIPPEDAPGGNPTAPPAGEAEKKKEPPKNEQKARTSDAAAAILQKYARRPRTT